MKSPQVKLVPRNRRWNADVMIHERHRMDPRGDLFVKLVQHMTALAVYRVVHEPSGNMIIRNVTDEEAVTRAEQLVDMIYAKLEDRNWVLTVPDLEELEAFGGDEPAGFKNGE